jgi:hypothetical protein
MRAVTLVKGGRLLAAGIVVVVASVATAVPASAGDPTVEVRDLHVAVDAGVTGRLGGRVEVDVTYRVVNTGKQAIRPTTRLRVSSQIGGGTTSRSSRIPTLAPDESFEVREVVTGVLPFGSVTATVTVRADGATTTATASAAVIPWFLLLAIVLAAAVTGLAWRRRVTRRRNRTPGRSPVTG